MPLYVLRPRAPDDVPFVPVIDRNYGFVVRAEDEAGARALADAEAKSEGTGTWLDPTLTTCDLIESGGPAVILARYVSRE